MNQLLERNKKQRKARKVDTSISNEVFGTKKRPDVPFVTIQHPAGRAAGPNYTETQNNGLRPVGHLDYREVQTPKPSRRSTPRTDIADTYLMQAATDGKMTGVDGHCPTDSWGHKFSGFEKTGLAGNKLHTAELSVKPESVLGGQHDGVTHSYHVPPESKLPKMEEMHTQEIGTWKYTQPEWC